MPFASTIQPKLTKMNTRGYSGSIPEPYIVSCAPAGVIYKHRAKSKPEQLWA